MFGDGRLRRAMQMLPDFLVSLVDIQAKLQRTILADKGGLIDKENRHRLGQRGWLRGPL